MTEHQSAAARGLSEELAADGVRVQVAGTEESLSKRVRTAEVERVPYVLVLGERELAEGTVALRIPGTKGTQSLSRPELRARLVERIRRREFEP